MVHLFIWEIYSERMFLGYLFVSQGVLTPSDFVTENDISISIR